MVGLAVDPMAACSIRFVFAFSCNLVLCRSDDRAICCYMGPFNTRIWNTCSNENEMIGDIALQLTIFKHWACSFHDAYDWWNNYHEANSAT